MMGTMASSMAGSMMGNALFSSMSGGRGEAAPVEGQAPPQGQMAQGGMPPAPQACAFETRSFLECMEGSQNNMEYCARVFEQFKHCNAQAAYGMQQQQYN